MEIIIEMNPLDLDDPSNDSLVYRNYQILGKYLMKMVDKGLDFLKNVYIDRNSETSFQEFAAENYYDYILRDYLRRKIKTQMKFLLKSAIFSIASYHQGVISSEFLDNLFFIQSFIKKFHQYLVNLLSIYYYHF